MLAEQHSICGFFKAMQKESDPQHTDKVTKELFMDKQWNGHKLAKSVAWTQFNAFICWRLDCGQKASDTSRKWTLVGLEEVSVLASPVELVCVKSTGL